MEWIQGLEWPPCCSCGHTGLYLQDRGSEVQLCTHRCSFSCQGKCRCLDVLLSWSMRRKMTSRSTSAHWPSRAGLRLQARQSRCPSRRWRPLQRQTTAGTGARHISDQQGVAAVNNASADMKLSSTSGQLWCPSLYCSKRQRTDGPPARPRSKLEEVMQLDKQAKAAKQAREQQQKQEQQQQQGQTSR
jgi:hypothetical protein